MPAEGFGLTRVLARLEADDAFLAECRREIREAAGDEAILAFMRVATRHGYRINFREAKAAARQALGARPGEGKPAEGRLAARNALRAAVSAQSGRTLTQFIKAW